MLRSRGAVVVKTARLQITLREVTPTVRRVIDIPASTTLAELHELIQAAMGWTDSHLHQFRSKDAVYGINRPDLDIWPPDQRDETTATLAALGPQFTYVYDFGDDWAHDVEVLGPGSGTPGCVYGEGTCPPEDVGGPGGYAHLLEVLDDPTHDEYTHLQSWSSGGLRPFDRDVTDTWIRRVVGEVPASVRLLLDLTAPGMKLTPGGRLPRTIVRAVQDQHPDWYPLGRPARIEEDLPPLVHLHDLLRQIGLLRLRHGVLAPTKAAGDDLAVIRRIRGAFDPDSFTTLVAERAVAILAVHGTTPIAPLAELVFPLLGHRWQINGEPITARDVESTLRYQSQLMTALDLIHRDRAGWSPGPSARSLLPAATMLAEILPTPTS